MIKYGHHAAVMYNTKTQCSISWEGSVANRLHIRWDRRKASDITISLRSTDLSEWVAKYFFLILIAREWRGKVGTFWKREKINARMFDVFLRIFLSPSRPLLFLRPDKSRVLFPPQWLGPIRISRTEFQGKTISIVVLAWRVRCSVYHSAGIPFNCTRSD